MLVLTRKPNEGITIGEDVIVTVLSVEGDKVKLGIDAPRNVKVFRNELIADIVTQNRLAMQSQFVSFRKNTESEGEDEK